MGLLYVKKEMCLNYRIKDAQCRVCMDACPKRALRVGEGDAAFGQACDQCGICARRCPAGAIGWEDAPRYPLESKDGKAEVYCRKLKCDGYVGCLAHLNEYELVYLALQAEIILCYDEKACRACRGGTADEIQTLVRRANIFLRKIGGYSVAVAHKDKQAAEQLSRRELFGFLFAKAKRSLADVLPAARQDTDYRRLLLGALSQRQATETENAAPLFFGLEASGCTLCGVCIKICKNKALTIEMEEGSGAAYLKHSQSLCTGCGACEKICPVHALRLSDTHSRLSAVRALLPMAIAAAKAAKCTRCGAFLPGMEGTLCGSCRLRENKKMQAIY